MVCFRIYGLEFWCPVWYLDSLRPNWKIKSDSGDRSVGRTWVVWPPNIVHSFLLKKSGLPPLIRLTPVYLRHFGQLGNMQSKKKLFNLVTQPGHPSQPGQPGVLYCWAFLLTKIYSGHIGVAACVGPEQTRVRWMPSLCKQLSPQTLGGSTSKDFTQRFTTFRADICTTHPKTGRGLLGRTPRLTSITSAWIYSRSHSQCSASKFSTQLCLE